MILRFRITPDNHSLIRRAANARGLRVRRFVREIALGAARRQLTDTPAYEDLVTEIEGLHEYVTQLEKQIFDAMLAKLPEGTTMEISDSAPLVASKALVAKATAEPRRVLTDPMIEQREEVLAAALAEIGKTGTKFGGHGGPEIEHIVRADDNEYQRYWIVLTAAGKRALAVIDPKTTNWGAKVLALVRRQKVDGVAYIAPPEDWCAMFVTWAIGQVFAPGMWWDWKRPGHVIDEHPFGRWFGGVTQTREWAEAEGVYVHSDATRAPPIGSVFVMPGDTHVGFVLEDLGGGRFKTIEGNLSNSVKSVERNVADCAGFVLWWAAA